MENFYDYWLKLGKWTSEQAAFIFQDIDPSQNSGKVKFTIRAEDNFKVHKKEWQRKVYQTYSIFETASQSDWAGCIVELEESYAFSLFNWRPPKEASPGVFFYLAEMKGVKIPEKIREAYFNHLKNIDEVKYSRAMVRALKSYKHQATKKSKADSESVDGDELSETESKSADNKEYEEAFDPLPLGVIAGIFRLKKDDEENLKRWQYYAGKASQNGLRAARVEVRRGKAQSTFNPYLVGCWVILRNDGLTPDSVNRKLSNALPSRSVHLKDETFV